MILGGDVGGTKVHLALFENTAQMPMLYDIKYKSRDFANFASLLADFIAQYPNIKIDKACFGIAGPVQNGRCQATNLPWIVDARELSREMKIQQVWLINDLEANAWGLRCLRQDEFHLLNQGVKTQGNQVLIAAGTGLGEAGLYWDGTGCQPFACEGGHADFAPCDEEQVELWRYLWHQLNHVSYERVLSGPGIYQIYRFLIDTGRERPSPSLEKLAQEKEPQKLIGEQAIKGECPACVRTMDLFASIYGSEAGNLALKMLAIGGVYVGGGIAPKILPILQKGSFLKAFLAKGRFAPLLSQIPIQVVLNDNTALLGAGRYAYEKK
jgi:glucokinase